jgi:hypothetical protein
MAKPCTTRHPLPAATGLARRPAPHCHHGSVSYLTRPPAAPVARPYEVRSAAITPAVQAIQPGAVTRTSARPATADRALRWLRGAMAALAVAAATASWDAQYVLVRSVEHNPAIAGLEAGLPDIGAVIFAALGVALALHGRCAIRARVLNVACVWITLAMNALASAPGWRDLAIWVMPPAAYALASDTLIGVVLAWVIARAKHAGHENGSRPLACVPFPQVQIVRDALRPAGAQDRLLADLDQAMWCDVVLAALAGGEDVSCLLADPLAAGPAFAELLGWVLNGKIPARYRRFAPAAPFPHFRLPAGIQIL